MTADNVIGLLAAAALAMVIYASRPFTPPPSTAGLAAIPQTAAKLVPWSEPADAVQTLEAVDAVTGQSVARFVLGRDGILRLAGSQPQLPAGEHGIRLIATPIIALGERSNTIGAFAGVFSGALHNGHRAQAGLRYEPFAFLAGTLHTPSFALTPDLVGVGATVSLPVTHFPTLSHFDVGCWEAAPFDGSRPALLYGAGFHLSLP